MFAENGLEKQNVPQVSGSQKSLKHTADAITFTPGPDVIDQVNSNQIDAGMSEAEVGQITRSRVQSVRVDSGHVQLQVQVRRIAPRFPRSEACRMSIL